MTTIKKVLLSLTLCLICIQTTLAQLELTPPITPKWAFGHIVWEDNRNTQEDAIKLVNLYLEHQMPVDGIIIDSPWSNSYNDLNWDTQRYPKSSEMIQTLNEKGVKVILWLTGALNTIGNDVPLQKNPYFDEVVEKGFVVNNGEESEWWKGKGVYIDFTNPEAVQWWNKQLDKVTIEGVYGFKVDNAASFFGDTVKTSIGELDNTTFRQYYYSSMSDYITSKKSDGIILARPYSHQGGKTNKPGVYAPVNKLGLGWCGDFSGNWKGIKLQINNIYKSAEFGYGAISCEVGGFWRAGSTKQQLIRYAQFGAFTAAMVNGGMNGAFTNHLPWWHDEETTKAYRQAVWLHEQLVPYLFSAGVDAHKNGGTIIQNWSYEQESHTLGESIFTKIISSENNSVTFNLPKQGEWMDFWTKKVHSGGTEISNTYALNQYPFFIKKGAIIPMEISNNFSSIGDASLAGKQTIYILPDDNKSTYQYHMPLSDGIDYETVNITYNGNKNSVKVDGTSNQPYAFLIQSELKPKRVKNADEWVYDAEKKELFILKRGAKFSMKLKF
ncbi:TIM-barrel domain-containing protein [uncultured Algibacter sp.]|uniref:TIM-barrel domain-containing protein n=1 Tax=uncultured Algibacter sp. TaxID=298659 RepID=UPI00260D08E2|nr:TIM-barrel domain-containing protein [uncultured Algibacter sp.]